MRLAASVPGGIEGKCAFSVRPSHQRSSAPRLAPMLTATIDLHISRCLYLIARAARNGSSMLPPLDIMRNSLTPLLAAAALAAVLTGCSQQSRQHAADERLSAIYSSEWKWRTDQLPDNEDSTLPIADHLPKVDALTQDMRRKYWEDVLRRVEAIARSSLSAKEQLNYDIYRAQIEVLIADQRFR